MPRNYKRVTVKVSWREENLQGALRAMQNGVSMRTAAIKFVILKSTLHERHKNANISGSALNGKSVFSIEAGNALAVPVKMLRNLFME